MIPHATKAMTTMSQIPGNVFCGRSKGLATAGAATTSVTVCCEYLIEFNYETINTLYQNTVHIAHFVGFKLALSASEARGLS